MALCNRSLVLTHVKSTGCWWGMMMSASRSRSRSQTHEVFALSTCGSEISLGLKILCWVFCIQPADREKEWKIIYVFVIQVQKRCISSPLHTTQQYEIYSHIAVRRARKYNLTVYLEWKCKNEHLSSFCNSPSFR